VSRFSASNYPEFDVAIGREISQMGVAVGTKRVIVGTVALVTTPTTASPSMAIERSISSAEDRSRPTPALARTEDALGRNNGDALFLTSFQHVSAHWDQLRALCRFSLFGIAFDGFSYRVIA